jgi:SAM-dependent methyltransferase
MDRNDPAYEGQREYTPLFLRIYDPVILGVLAPVVWRCPASRLLEGYRRHTGHRHLDVGPGTAYFLDRAGLPGGTAVTLLDPNRNVLDHASRRLQRLAVTTIEADVLKPLPVDGPFDSAALNGVLHCLPGPLPSKAAAVANVAAVLAPEGVLFGSSILGATGRHTWLGRRILEANNRRGTFDNLGDTEVGLGEILSAWFERVELDTVGAMAIFTATSPRTKPSTDSVP